VPRVMAIEVHPFVTGQPHRIDAALEYICSHEGVWRAAFSVTADVVRPLRHGQETDRNVEEQPMSRVRISSRSLAGVSFGRSPHGRCRP
jgi:hypothetical protein